MKLHAVRLTVKWNNTFCCCLLVIFCWLVGLHWLWCNLRYTQLISCTFKWVHVKSIFFVHIMRSTVNMKIKQRDFNWTNELLQSADIRWRCVMSWRKREKVKFVARTYKMSHIYSVSNVGESQMITINKLLWVTIFCRVFSSNFYSICIRF